MRPTRPPSKKRRKAKPSASRARRRKAPQWGGVLRGGVASCEDERGRLDLVKILHLSYLHTKYRLRTKRPDLGTTPDSTCRRSRTARSRRTSRPAGQRPRPLKGFSTTSPGAPRLGASSAKPGGTCSRFRTLVRIPSAASRVPAGLAALAPTSPSSRAPGGVRRRGPPRGSRARAPRGGGPPSDPGRAGVLSKVSTGPDLSPG